MKDNKQDLDYFTTILIAYMT